jgi:NAD(P)-dependent dehydrogenase (short-subunit alcohol dehydrogenase family)
MTTIVVTGASSGIGARTALDLAAAGVHVVLVGRNEERLAATAAMISPAPRYFVTDFARLADVRRLAQQLRDNYDRLDALLNNAGIHTRTRQTTVDGNELTNQVNHLAPFLLTELVRDLLAGGRVVMTGSMFAEGIRPDDLNRERIRWSSWGAYKASKQANALFAVELAGRGAATGLVSTCCHPGMLRTGFAGESRGYQAFRKLWPWAFKPVEVGSAALTNLALGPAGIEHPGVFFNEQRPDGWRPKWVKDTGLAHRVWTSTERMLEAHIH